MLSSRIKSNNEATKVDRKIYFEDIKVVTDMDDSGSDLRFIFDNLLFIFGLTQKRSKKLKAP